MSDFSTVFGQVVSVDQKYGYPTITLREPDQTPVEFLIDQQHLRERVESVRPSDWLRLEANFLDRVFDFVNVSTDPRVLHERLTEIEKRLGIDVRFENWRYA